jgi:hypothetical protein
MVNRFWTALTLLALTACTKVIDLKVRNADAQYVIEANITDQPGPYTITISRTDTFSSSYQFQGVGGANVSLQDDAGNSETLKETQPGIYQTSTLTGVEGRTYSLHITANGHVFTSSSTMPARVNFDSLYVREIINISKTVKAAVPIFTDPRGQGNSYRFNQYINGRLDKALYYQNDDFSDGLRSTFALLQPDPDSTLRPNDQVEVDMQCIDKPMYKYWFSLDQSANGNGASIPSNPVTNIQGGALGYFSAHTSQRRSLLVK